VPSTVVIPTASGRTAARPRKKTSDSSSRTGNASASARPRSATTLSPIWDSAKSDPPSATSRAPSSRSVSPLNTASSSASAASVAARYVARPSRLTKRGSFVDSTEVTDAIPGSAASVRCTAAIRARAAGDSAPDGVRSSAITPGVGSVPMAASMRSTARADPESVGKKPPESSSAPATGPPKTPASATKTTTASSVRFGRAVRRSARAVNTWELLRL
jgi:hypothetical protein